MSMPPTNNPDVASSSSPSTAATDNFSLASSSSFSSSSSIPRGYKFDPTETDIFYYLNLFLQGFRDLLTDVPIHRANIYESTPEQLTKKYIKGNETECFFITERTKMSAGGKNYIRSDNGGGHWKVTHGGSTSEAEHGVVGQKNALVYYIGSVKGDWLMSEYSCNSYGHNDKVDHALCKIYLAPSRTKRKAEEAENERKKKKKKVRIEEVVEALQEEVELPLDVSVQQPETSQPQQRPSSAMDSHQAQPVLPDDGAHYSSDYEPQELDLDICAELSYFGFLDYEFYEMITSQPVIQDNDDANYLGDLDPQLQKVKECEDVKTGLLEDVVRQWMK